VKLLLLSFDSTIPGNLSLGLPIDILVYKRDSLAIAFEKRLGADDPYLATIGGQWSDALRDPIQPMPDFPLNIGREGRFGRTFGRNRGCRPGTRAALQCDGGVPPSGLAAADPSSGRLESGRLAPAGNLKL
jgi:hypothetical protein